MINGIINIYKEPGYTSHDVVAKLRRILSFKHIGHTGTLDPMASGVLPVCIGSATKLCDLETEKTKVYEAVILFGTATDTEDVTGNVILTMPVNCNKDDLVSKFPLFIGDIMQKPPMYSAIKVSGKKLYEIARSGKTIDVPLRPVTIKNLELMDYVSNEDGTLKEARIRITCGKGTYIRSLCRDLGETLGTCACMKELVRTKTGRFEISDAVTLKQIQEAFDNNEVHKYILPIDGYFSDYPEFITAPECDYLLHNGNELGDSDITLKSKGECYRAYDSLKKFYGIYYFDNRKQKYKPQKMFIEM